MVTGRVACKLCELPTAHPVMDEAGHPFCCPACREVSALLGEERLSPQSGSGQSLVRPASSLNGQLSTTTETTTLSLAGLWCPSCAWLIDKTVCRIPGVQEAKVNFLQREARVTFEPERTDPDHILGQIRRLGYRAWLPGHRVHDEEDSHLTRLLISGVLVMHVMVISVMLYMRDWLGLASADTAWLAHFFQIMLLVASLPVILILGIPILRAGLASLLCGRPNTHTLIALGAFSAFTLSVRNLMVGQDVYFDTAAVLLFLVALGRWLEMRAQKASGQAVERLWQEMPPEATWIKTGGEQQIAADQVPPGARVRVRPGQRFPVDGLVATGRGDVDESLLTGEPEPVSRQAGDRVLAGTLNLDGAFDVITTAVGGETVAGQIGHLLHQALWQRAPIEQLADRVAAWMVPLAVFLSIGSFAFWSLQAGIETGLTVALSVLLIACPCALGIATPLTLWLGLERAASTGVILRHTGVLEQLASVDHLFFDKTGTLTQRPIRLQAVATDGLDEVTFLARVTAVETNSEHPLAQAVVADAAERGIRPTSQVSDFQALPGQGVSAAVSQTPIWVGNRGLMAAHDLALPARLASMAERWQRQGMRVLFAGWDGQVVGLLGLGETARPEAADTLARVQSLGVYVAVLTGDDAAAGNRWQQLLGVPVHAQQQPRDKMARLHAVPGTVAMVGDGINDGPALAAATVGLAVHQGTDVAQAAADAVLLSPDLRAVPWLISLSRAAMGKVRQNLAWAFLYNLIGLALAVTGHLQPVLAALAMVTSSLIVTSNALRLRKVDIGHQPAANDDPASVSDESLQPSPTAVT